MQNVTKMERIRTVTIGWKSKRGGKDGRKPPGSYRLNLMMTITIRRMEQLKKKEKNNSLRLGRFIDSVVMPAIFAATCASVVLFSLFFSLISF